MSVLSDRWIKKMAQEKEMIKPFVPEQKEGNIISYGLSSFGYDARVSNEFKIFNLGTVFKIHIFHLKKILLF